MSNCKNFKMQSQKTKQTRISRTNISAINELIEDCWQITNNAMFYYKFLNDIIRKRQDITMLCFFFTIVLNFMQHYKKENIQKFKGKRLNTSVAGNSCRHIIIVCRTKNYALCNYYKTYFIFQRNIQKIINSV